MRTLSIGKVLLSLTGTPWLVLLSTSIPLYLNNRVDLNFQWSVLLPYFYLFFACVVFASLTYFAARKAQRPTVLRRLLWSYYLLGWAFSSTVALYLTDASSGVKLGALLAGLGVLVYLVVFLEKKFDLSKAVGFWAVLSAGLILTESLTFYNAPDIHSELFPEESRKNQLFGSGKRQQAQYERRPNVYHIVLDEFQTDMFLLALSDEARTHFAGFTFFPETTTQSGRTDMSIPSSFTGRNYDFDTRQFEYQKSAFNGDASFLYWLKDKGYESYAYLHPIWSFELGLFDHIRIHEAAKLDQGRLVEIFQQLWIYSNLPESIASLLIGREDLEQLNNQNMLAPTAPLMSFQTMQLITNSERSFAESNRYTFAHLMFPHFPYVFDNDCGYDPDRTTATPLSQSVCAINLMTDFIGKLKKLGRFSDSLIIFHSDHGARFKVEQDRLVSVESLGTYSIPWSIARSRALLLIKPPGVSDDSSMTVSDFEASLVDIAPSVNALLALGMNEEFSGHDLFSPPDGDIQRVRHYHFYEKKGKGGWTDEMTRYRISNSKLSFDSKVKLTNNAPGD